MPKNSPPFTPAKCSRKNFCIRWRSPNTVWPGISAFHPARINEIVQGKRAITADTALRLVRFFGMEPQFWLNLQSRFELEKAEDELGDRLNREIHPLGQRVT